MRGTKVIAYCIGFVILIVVVGISMALILETFGPRIGQEITEEVSEIIPGFDSIAFVMSFICIFPIAMILIKRKIEKKS